MGVALIIFLLILLLWPTIMKWIRAYMARRAEDFIRNATGMPPRPGSRQERKQRERAQTASDSGSRYGRRARKSGWSMSPDEPIIPKEYAEDVEFVETKDYSETTVGDIDGDGHTRVRYHESQVTDVEWEEIKTKSGKRS